MYRKSTNVVTITATLSGGKGAATECTVLSYMGFLQWLAGLLIAVAFLVAEHWVPGHVGFSTCGAQD